MRTRNPSYGRSRDVTLGRVAARRASSTGITVTDGSTDVSPTTEIVFRGLEVTDLTEGIAEVTNSGLGNFIENGDAADLEAGDVVVLDATTNTVLKTTTAQDTRPVGVVQRSMLVGESGPVIFSGFVDLVNVTASVTAGNYAETSTTGGQATENATRRTGSFGTFLTGGTSPTAYLWGATETTSGGASGGTPDWVNVVDYGATGDGTTDDTAAVQAAIDATPELGTTFFPIGIYKITSTLTISQSQRLLGSCGYPGGATDSGSIIRMATNNTTAISTADLSFVALEGLYIHNNGTAASGRGVYALGTIVTRNLHIRSFYDNLFIDGVNGNSYFSLIHDSWFALAARAGVYLDGKVNNIRFFGSRFASNAKGLYASGGIEGATVADCDFEDNTSVGIEWDGTGSSQTADSIRITGGWFDNNGASHISVGPTTLVQGVTVADCFFEINAPANEDALKTNYCDRLTVIGSHFKATSGTSSISCNTSNTTNVLLINVEAEDTVTTPATTRIIDQTDVTPAVVGSANAVGSSKYFARADHAHQGAPYGADYLVGTTQSGLSSEIVVGTTPGGDLGGTWGSPLVEAIQGVVVTDTGTTGAVLTKTGAATATWTAAPADNSGEILISDTPAGSPLVFADLLQNEAQDDLLYAD